MAINDPPADDWKGARRLRAWELKQQGWTQRHIAEAFGVTEAAVSRWIAAAQTGGPEALRARSRSGAPARLSEAQRLAIPELLSQGVEAYGFRGQVWTCGRVAEVIRRKFGISSTRATSHASSASWDGRRRCQSGEPRSGMRPRSHAGGPKSGPT